MSPAGLEKGFYCQIWMRAVCQDQNAYVLSLSECAKTVWQTVDLIFLADRAGRINIAFYSHY
jgi:hypothetical protein